VFLVDSCIGSGETIRLTREDSEPYTCNICNPGHLQYSGRIHIRCTSLETEVEGRDLYVTKRRWRKV